MCPVTDFGQLYIQSSVLQKNYCISFQIGHCAVLVDLDSVTVERVVVGNILRCDVRIQTNYVLDIESISIIHGYLCACYIILVSLTYIINKCDWCRVFFCISI